MNEEQRLRLMVASEQMAAMTDSSAFFDMKPHAILKEAVVRADALIAEIECTAKPAPVEAAPYYLSDHPVQTSLVALEDWALQGGVLIGDDASRFRALADRIAPASVAAAKHPGWVVEDYGGTAWGSYAEDPEEPWQAENMADAPFPTREAAEQALQVMSKHLPGLFIRPWRPTDRVPPMPEGEMMNKFTVEQLEKAINELDAGRYCSGDSDVIGMLRAYAARLREDALDTRMLDFLDAHPKLVLRTGKQALRPMILAAMREQGEG